MDAELETKVPKFEYLSHSRSAPAHMAATSKWSKDAEFLTSLKKREYTLFLQHQQALEERLKEEDLKKQDEQRLEEILHMFSEFEKEQQEKNNSESDGNIAEKMKEMKLDESIEINNIPQQSENCVDNHKHFQTPNNSEVVNHPISRLYPNRIKTNGSLPQQDQQRWANEVGMYVNHRALEASSSDDDDVIDKTTAASRSPRTRIKTVPTISSAPDIYENTWVDSNRSLERGQRPSSAVMHIQKQLSELQHQSNETIHELKVEYALVEGEEKEEASHYQEEKSRLEKLQQNEINFKQELELSKTKEWHKLEQARAQLQEGEQQSETEDQLDGLRKNFEDLEFQYFESQAHNEEQCEHISLQIEQLKETLAQREIRLLELRNLLQSLQAQMEDETSQFHTSQSALLQALAQAQDYAKKMTHSPASSESVSFGEKVVTTDLHDSECSSLTSAPEYESNLTDDSSLLHQNMDNWADTAHVKRRSKSNTLRPLTQYLPSRSPDLNLLQHVEAAGHQASLCPHIRITSTTCRGPLHKLGWLAWRRRWFLFDWSRRLLVYFSDRAETRPRGAVSFQAIEEVYVDHGSSIAKRSPNPRATFCVKTSERLFHLAAQTPEAMSIWVDVIFTGAEGYLDFLEEDLDS